MNILRDACMVLIAQVFVLCPLCFESVQFGEKFILRKDFKIVFFIMSKLKEIDKVMTGDKFIHVHKGLS